MMQAAILSGKNNRVLPVSIFVYDKQACRQTQTYYTQCATVQGSLVLFIN